MNRALFCFYQKRPKTNEQRKINRQENIMNMKPIMIAAIAAMLTTSCAVKRPVQPVTKTPLSKNEGQQRIAEPEDQDWNSAEAVGSPAAYDNYLKRSPDGKHANEARQILADFERYAPKQIADQGLSADGVGALKVEVADPQTVVFVVPCPSGLTLTKDDRVSLRDALLSSSPVNKDARKILKPGRYVIALKKSFVRQSKVNSDLGNVAPGNLFVAPSKDSDYELVVGGGIRAGALFKSVRDVYLTYTGAFFAQGPGSPNNDNLKNYKYPLASHREQTPSVILRFSEETQPTRAEVL
jgi:hypothetical protein